MMHSIRIVSVALGAQLAVSPLWALGSANMGNEVPSARSAGQGYVSIAAQSNDPVVVYANPAGMTKLKGTQMMSGFQWENINGSYKSDAGQTTKAKTLNAAVPNFALTRSLAEGKLAVGLSIQSPFGLETHWPGNSPLRYVTTNSRLAMSILSPAVAVQVHRTVSIGVGLDMVNAQSAQMERNLNVDALNAAIYDGSSGAIGAHTSGSPDGVYSMKGKGTALGWHGGLLIEPHERHALGIAYHSQAKVRILGNVKLSSLGNGNGAATVFGGSDYETSAYTDMVVPSNVQVGYAYKPNDRWMIEADAAWFHWSSGRDLRIRYAETDSTRLALLNAGNPAPLNLRDAWSAAVGANYKASAAWEFRTGYWYEPWAMPESTFNPAYNDLSRHGLSLGFGHALTERLTLDVAYSAVLLTSRSIHNGLGLAGTFRNFVNITAAGFTYRWGD